MHSEVLAIGTCDLEMMSIPRSVDPAVRSRAAGEEVHSRISVNSLLSVLVLYYSSSII